MKAVIVDIKGNKAIALSKTGEFLKIRNTGRFSVGNEIDVPQTRVFYSRNFLMKAASIAAAFVFTMGMGYGVYSYCDPYSYINMDINPSIEIVANKYNRTIAVNAINSDGEKLLDNKSFKNKAASSVVEDILKRAAEKGYIGQDKSSAVMLTVSSKDEKKIEEIEYGVQEAAKAELAATGDDAEVLVEHVSIEKHDEAKSMDISPGKLLLIKKLQSVDPQIKLEDVKSVSVKDILTELKEKDNKAAKKQEDTDSKESKDKKKTQDNQGQKQDKDSNKEELKANKKEVTKYKEEQQEGRNKSDKASTKEKQKPHESSNNIKDKKDRFDKDDKYDKDEDAEQDKKNTNSGQKQKEKNKDFGIKNSKEKPVYSEEADKQLEKLHKQQEKISN